MAIDSLCHVSAIECLYICGCVEIRGRPAIVLEQTNEMVERSFVLNKVNEKTGNRERIPDSSLVLLIQLSVKTVSK